MYDVEPLPADHPLRSAPRTVLSPHLGYVGTDTYRTFFADAVEDIAAWLGGTRCACCPDRAGTGRPGSARFCRRVRLPSRT